MQNLTVGKERDVIISFAWPMLLANAFQQLYNVVDSIVVGKFIGHQALAAVGSSFPIIFVLISLFIGIGSGFTIQISQYYGAQRMDMLKRAVDTMYILLLVSSIIVTITGYLIVDPIFTLIQMPDEILGMSIEYFLMYVSGSIFFFGFSGTNAILRGLGNSKIPLVFQMIATVVNIVLDIFFVVYLDWGVKGVALATIIAQAGAFVTLLFYINKKYPTVFDLRLRWLVVDYPILKQALRIGLPSGFQHSFVALGMVALFAIVNPFGSEVIAAYSVALRLDSFASLPAMNFAAALTAFVGQNIGAKKPERVKAGLRTTLWWVNSIAIVMGLIMVFFGETLMVLFTDSATVIEEGAQYLRITGLFYTIFSSMFVMYAVLRGAGDTLFPMIMTFISLWLFRLPLAYFLSKEMGTIGIWISAPVAWMIGLIASIVYYNTGKWKKRILLQPPTTKNN